MNRIVKITAPCRLHFGLLRFAQAAGLSYGGLGMMLDQPATVVKMQQADSWKATGPNANRALAFAIQAARYWSAPDEASFAIEVQKAPPTHAGLGSGTQLALAVARGVSLLCNLRFNTDDPDTDDPDAEDLSAAVGRGQRSGIGSHGFLQGGLLWETGRDSLESLAKLTRRLDIPEPWRVLLISPLHDTGLHGSAEIDAFAQLPPVPPEITEQLQHLAEARILPAIEQADFAAFSESIYQYGHLAGSCFTSVQGGPYASSDVDLRIKKLRSLGLLGVGQSSWGPTIFAFTHNTSIATHWVKKFAEIPEFNACEIAITAPNNHGASVVFN